MTSVSAKAKGKSDLDALSKVLDEIVDDSPEGFRAIIANLSEETIKALMFPKSGPGCYALFPSQYPGPYPGNLAKLLVTSDSQESVTDVLNTFYSRRRKLSPEALKIFMDNIAKMPLQKLEWQLNPNAEEGKFEWDADMPPNGWTEAPDDIKKKMLMRLPKEILALAIGQGKKKAPGPGPGPGKRAK